MSQAPPPPAAGSNPPPAKKGMGLGTKLAIGCAGTLLVCVLICGGIGFYLYANFKSIASGAATTVITQNINQSKLSADQKQKLIARVEDLRQRFVDGEITTEQIARVGTALAESPLFYVGSVMFIEHQYIALPRSASRKRPMHGERWIVSPAACTSKRSIRR